MLDRGSNRFFEWLGRRIDAARGEADASRHCLLAAGAQILPEAEVNNFTGERSAISVGARSAVRGRLLTYGHGGRIRIGEWCYLGVRSEIWSMDSIEIGDRVLISHDVNIHDGTAHSADPAERHQHYRHIIEQGHPTGAVDLPGVHSAPIVIEDDVWISFGVTILRGVRIGARSIIAAGSTVLDDVPPDCIYRNRVEPQISRRPPATPVSATTNPEPSKE